MTTNIDECMNLIFRHARKFSVTTLLEHIRCLLQRWLYKRWTIASFQTTTLSDYTENIIVENLTIATKHVVHNINQFNFEVRNCHLNEFMDLHVRSCSCQVRLF